MVFFLLGCDTVSQVIPGPVGESDSIKGVITIAPPYHYNTIHHYDIVHRNMTYYITSTTILSTIYHITTHRPPYHHTTTHIIPPNSESKRSLIHNSQITISNFHYSLPSPSQPPQPSHYPSSLLPFLPPPPPPRSPTTPLPRLR